MERIKGRNSATMKDAMKYLPKAIERLLNPLLLLPPLKIQKTLTKKYLMTSKVKELKKLSSHLTKLMSTPN